MIHSIEKESDKIDSVNHKIKLIEFEDKNISEQKSAAIQKIRQDIDNYESSIIKKNHGLVVHVLRKIKFLVKSDYGKKN